MRYDDYTVDELKDEISSRFDKDEEEVVKLALWSLRNEDDIPEDPNNLLSRKELWKVVSSGTRISLLNTLVEIFREERGEGLITMGREYQRIREEDREIWDDLLLSKGLEKDEDWKVIPSRGEIVRCEEMEEEPDEEMIHYG